MDLNRDSRHSCRCAPAASRLIRVQSIATLAILVFALRISPLNAQTRDEITDNTDDRVFRIFDETNADAVRSLRSGDGNIGQSNSGAIDSTGQSRSSGVDGPNDRLIDRVVDPISWLMDFRFREDWNWPAGNSGPDSQQFEFRPTIPFKAWDQVNLLRVTIPYDIQGSSGAGLDKVTMFDALIFEPDWGRWGIGPEIRFDPHSTTGQDEFQIGPVFGAIAKSKHWTAGFICQNFLSGNDSETQIQPILAYKFNEKLALAIGDMQFKYDWNKRTWSQIPLGIELDYIADLWGQKMQFFINPQYNFETSSSSSGWTVFVGFTLLVPDA
jgi:hypothetical protein